MTRHGGDVLVEMLLAYGVPAVFGLAGGQTLPLYDAIRSRAPRIRHVPMRDERNAAYAADGYARLSGRVGVCDATVGPGAMKLTSGLAEAFNSSIPLVALVSDMPSDWVVARYRGGGNQAARPWPGSSSKQRMSFWPSASSSGRTRRTSGRCPSRASV